MFLLIESYTRDGFPFSRSSITTSRLHRSVDKIGDRRNHCIGTGVTEWWSDGFKTQYSNIPLLQHSILFARLASEIFLSSLESGFFSNLLD